MNRFRGASLVACAAVLAAVAGASTLLDNPGAIKFCNKICAIGTHCVPTPQGGKCVPGGGVALLAANTVSCGVVASTAASQCPACTILCPYGTHLVQQGNCKCRCVRDSG